MHVECAVIRLHRNNLVKSRLVRLGRHVRPPRRLDHRRRHAAPLEVRLLHAAALHGLELGDPRLRPDERLAGLTAAHHGLKLRGGHEGHHEAVGGVVATNGSLHLGRRLNRNREVPLRHHCTPVLLQDRGSGRGGGLVPCEAHDPDCANGLEAARGHLEDCDSRHLAEAGLALAPAAGQRLYDDDRAHRRGEALLRHVRPPRRLDHRRRHAAPLEVRLLHAAALHGLELGDPRLRPDERLAGLTAAHHGLKLRGGHEGHHEAVGGVVATNGSLHLGRRRPCLRVLHTCGDEAGACLEQRRGALRAVELDELRAATDLRLHDDRRCTELLILSLGRAGANGRLDAHGRRACEAQACDGNRATAGCGEQGRGVLLPGEASRGVERGLGIGGPLDTLQRNDGAAEGPKLALKADGTGRGLKGRGGAGLAEGLVVGGGALAEEEAARRSLHCDRGEQRLKQRGARRGAAERRLDLGGLGGEELLSRPPLAPPTLLPPNLHLPPCSSRTRPSCRGRAPSTATSRPCHAPAPGSAPRSCTARNAPAPRAGGWQGMRAPRAGARRIAVPPRQRPLLWLSPRPPPLPSPRPRRVSPLWPDGSSSSASASAGRRAGSWSRRRGGGRTQWRGGRARQWQSWTRQG